MKLLTFRLMQRAPVGVAFAAVLLALTANAVLANPLHKLTIDARCDTTTHTVTATVSDITSTRILTVIGQVLVNGQFQDVGSPVGPVTVPIGMTVVTLPITIPMSPGSNVFRVRVVNGKDATTLDNAKGVTSNIVACQVPIPAPPPPPPAVAPPPPAPAPVAPAASAPSGGSSTSPVCFVSVNDTGTTTELKNVKDAPKFVAENPGSFIMPKGGSCGPTFVAASTSRALAAAPAPAPAAAPAPAPAAEVPAAPVVEAAPAPVTEFAPAPAVETPGEAVVTPEITVEITIPENLTPPNTGDGSSLPDSDDGE